MLVLLPPSETKSVGGDGAPLDLGELSMPQLTETREMLVTALVDLSADAEASNVALRLGPKQADEIERNAKLWVSPTRPALERYTGVLFDALDAGSLTKAQREKALGRLAMGSALFGAVRAGDSIPAYRLSGGSKLPGFGTLQSLWKPELTDALLGEADGGLVVDLRSGVYRQLGAVPGALSATVLTEQPDGTRKVVSHFNKHHKGLLARALTVTRAEPDDIEGVARVAAKAGLRVEVASGAELVILT
ncbi:peroxide stress protein YaaA [Rhodococcus spongiicola]|uniref:Peroxide stress protein YaaA n=1 Tax=Rhodococcus spongiicola TaxID=2487352 RepID=A0A3S3AAZ8_9NOCA|nr:peroxide stress protein YaaA [Rhodococcus spongiicola]RVW03770.1 peroxide stress protein YaaA [Rhodococcus spongiicola]